MAFHSYTQLIQKLFNAYWCGPPYRVTGTSPWPSVDHSVSRLPPPTLRPVQARFHCGSARHRAPPRRRRQLVGSLCKRHAVTPEGAPTACGRTVSGTISLPWKGCFSPFPHGTRSLSVSREYLALPDGPGRFAQGSTCPALLRMPMGPVGLRVQDSHRLRSDFPDAFRSPQGCHHMVLLPRGRAKSTRPGLGCSPVARHYWGNHCCFLFLRVLRCFSSPRWPRHKKVPMAGLQPAGLSHSDTRGSKVICTYPRLIAAYRVLRRLREPRHPPCAFRNFHRCAIPKNGQGALILSAVSYPRKHSAGDNANSCLVLYSFALSQHVKDRIVGHDRVVARIG